MTTTTTERIEGTTPNGGDYAVSTFVRLDTLEAVDRAQANGVVIAEYTADDKWICETVAEFDPTAD